MKSNLSPPQHTCNIHAATHMISDSRPQQHTLDPTENIKIHLIQQHEMLNAGYDSCHTHTLMTYVTYMTWRTQMYGMNHPHASSPCVTPLNTLMVVPNAENLQCFYGAPISLCDTLSSLALSTVILKRWFSLKEHSHHTFWPIFFSWTHPFFASINILYQ